MGREEASKLKVKISVNVSWLRYSWFNFNRNSSVQKIRERDLKATFSSAKIRAIADFTNSLFCKSGVVL